MYNNNIYSTRAVEQNLHYLIKLMSEVPVFTRENLVVYLYHEYNMLVSAIICKSKEVLAAIDLENQTGSARLPTLKYLNVDLDNYISFTLDRECSEISNSDYEMIKTKLENDITKILSSENTEKSYIELVSFPNTIVPYKIIQPHTPRKEHNETLAAEYDISLFEQIDANEKFARNQDTLESLSSLLLLTESATTFTKYQISEIGLESKMTMRYIFIKNPVLNENQVLQEVCINKKYINKILIMLNSAINTVRLAEYSNIEENNQIRNCGSFVKPTLLDFETRLNYAKDNRIGNTKLAMKYIDDFLSMKITTLFANSPNTLDYLKSTLNLSDQTYKNISYGDAMTLATKFFSCSNNRDLQSTFSLILAKSFLGLERTNNK